MVRSPEPTIQGKVTNPIRPILQSARKAMMSPPIIAEKLIPKVETTEDISPLTSLESTPNREAANPPLFYFF